jgi:hypothetical protein
MWKSIFKLKSPTLILSIVWGVAVLFLATAIFVYAAWSPPTQAPTGGNASAPINVGTTTQRKSGAFGVGGVFETDRGTHLAVVTGNVGIGTTNPGARLTVFSPSGTRTASFDDGAAACCAPYYTVSINEGYGGNQPTLQFHDVGTAEGQIILQGDIGGGQRGFRFQSVQTSMGGRFTGNLLVDGNVGIGITTPTQRLDVAGSIRSVGGTIFAENAIAEGGNVALVNPLKTGARTREWRIWNMTGGYGDGLSFWRYFGDGRNMGPSVWFGDNGDVGIGVTNPVNRLDVAGDIAIHRRHAFRGTDTWLRLNQDGAFTSGVHTPGLFAPMSLNVGGAGNWGNPGAGNIWTTGNVGIGTTAPRGRLDVVGNVAFGTGTSKLELTQSGQIFEINHHDPGIAWRDIALSRHGGRVYIGNDSWFDDINVANALRLCGAQANCGVAVLHLGNSSLSGWGTNNIEVGGLAAGRIHAGAFLYISDGTLKTNIKPLERGALAKIRQLRGVSFDWIESEGGARSIGLIAQDVEPLFPEAVAVRQDGKKTVDYAKLAVPLIEAMKEQQEQIAELEKRIEALERELRRSAP